jgi:hypothetical protein
MHLPIPCPVAWKLVIASVHGRDHSVWEVQAPLQGQSHDFLKSPTSLGLFRMCGACTAVIEGNPAITPRHLQQCCYRRKAIVHCGAVTCRSARPWSRAWALPCGTTPQHDRELVALEIPVQWRLSFLRVCLFTVFRYFLMFSEHV